MTPEKIIELIQGGEKIDVEFKESKTAINKDVYSTVCAFNNRIGGHLILGVNDRKEIIGVDPAKVDALKLRVDIMESFMIVHMKGILTLPIIWNWYLSSLLENKQNP